LQGFRIIANQCSTGIARVYTSAEVLEADAQVVCPRQRNKKCDSQ
jgi:fructose-specific phosphotransferase system component IIB